MYFGLGSSVDTWKFACNIEIRRYSKKSDKLIKKKVNDYSYLKRLEKIKIDKFTWKKNEKWSNWNFQKD